MSNFWKAIVWIFSKLCVWGVVAVGAPLVYGLGVGALFGDEYIIASVLFSTAVVWITAKALTWEEMRGHENRKLISGVLIVFGIVIVAISLLWVKHRSSSIVHPEVTPTSETHLGNAGATGGSAALKPGEGTTPDKQLVVNPYVVSPILKTHSVSSLSPKSSAEPAPAAPNQNTPIVLIANIVNPKSPAIVVENTSDNVAEGITWELVLYRTRDLAFMSFATQNIGYVKPHSTGAKYSMDLLNIPKLTDGDPQIINGDVFIGTLAVDCPDCRGNTYIVQFVWGESGWLYELKDYHGKLAVAKDNTKEGKEAYIEGLDRLIPPNDKIRIQ
jgi:hypothetical protein